MKKSRRNRDAFAGNALAKIETGKRKHVDLGAEEKSKKKPELKDNNLSSEKKKRKKKKPNVDPEAAGNNKERTKDAKENQRVDSEAAENNNDATPYGKKKQKGNQVELVRGKRFTKEEDELIKKAVLEYIEAHVLGDQGINMVMNCRSHPQIKGCWKEITHSLPWRPHCGVYNRAHTLFEQGSKGIWSKEDLELVKEHQKKHGNHWKTLADAMGKHRRHLIPTSDAWRKLKLVSKKKGSFQEKRSQHGMLRDDIPWTAISNQLGTRENTTCCRKWYDQLTSPMVTKGIWANVDDYRLLDELTNLDAACVDDVDWDDLLDNRDGDACRSRWNQMVRHIGTKTFAEQVEIISQRYCPDIAEDRQDFDNRPYED
ncbi:hypothetical protein BRARA_E01997 [Brassica rapa]|uniref:Myb-like domain-containing protein n=1 Tax=Brassica campestris TaxID=3711 RepID=A0A397ZBC9_BRACM|nr:hypothetical protein BRARA_E01997 [Brassica rapa]